MSTNGGQATGRVATKARATLRDVARLAGVHLSTVSRVVNSKNTSMVSDEVAERIRRAAEELGYRANASAYSLRTRRSKTLGVLVSDITDPAFAPVIRAIEHSSRALGYTALIADSDNNPDNENLILEALRARNVDGIIFGTARRHDPMIEATIAAGLPTVQVIRAAEDLTACSITNDDISGMHLAIGHLHALGHRRIAYLRGPDYYSTAEDRYRGFTQAMAEHGLALDPSLMMECETYSADAGEAATRRLLESGQRFTAIAGANDLIAIGSLAALEAQGIACPEDVSVIGFNDMPFSERFRPALTTVHIDLSDMGRMAAERMIGFLENDAYKPEAIKLEPRLIVRKSTAEAREVTYP